VTVERLRAFVAGLAPGPVADPALIDLIAACWHELAGSREEGTTAGKLGRMETLRWEPPHLRFVLERHGGTVLGSTRASLHHWAVDVAQGTARIENMSRRQLEAMASRFDARGLADRIAEAVLVKKDLPELEWGKNRASFRLNPEAIPDLWQGFNKTLTGRRRRFRAELEARLGAHGWRCSSFSRWRLEAPPAQSP
jgi:hypothetical protein